MGLKELLGIGKGKSLLHTGCLLGKYENQEIRNNYEMILKKLGIDYVTEKDLGLDKRIICGSLALDLGFEKDFIKIARKNLKLMRELGVNRIITTCPECFKALSIDYKEFLMDWDLEIVFSLSLITKNLLGKRFFRDVGFYLTIHDSPYLVRYCGIVDEPRKLLGLLGHNIKELSYSGVNCFDSGSSGGLPFTNPQLANDLAVFRLKQLESLTTNTIVCLGIMDYEHLKRNSETNKLGIKVLEVSELLTHALGITKMEVKI